MAETRTGHADSGFAGAARMIGHKYSKPVAKWLVTRPWFLRLVGTSGMKKEELGAAIRVAFGFLNLPIGGTVGALSNSFVDDVAGEVAEILERRPELLTDAGRLPTTRDQAESRAREAASKEVVHVAEDIAHAKEECYLLVSHRAALTQPDRTVEKGGKSVVIPGRSDARILRVPLAEALRIGKVLCPLCFENGVEVRQRSEAASAPLETVLTLPERIRKMREGATDQNERQRLRLFESMFPQLEPKLRDKFIRLCRMDDPEPKLLLILERKVEEWEPMLDTVLGIDPEAKTVEGLVEKATGFVGRLAERAAKRLDGERGEMDRVIGQADAWLDADIAKSEAKAEKNEAKPRLGLSLMTWAAIASVITFIILIASGVL